MLCDSGSWRRRLARLSGGKTRVEFPNFPGCWAGEENRERCLGQSGTGNSVWASWVVLSQECLQDGPLDWVPKKQLLWKFRGGWLGILEMGG